MRSFFFAVIGKFGDAVNEGACVHGGQSGGCPPIEDALSLIATGKRAEILFAVCGNGLFFQIFRTCDHTVLDLLVIGTAGLSEIRIFDMRSMRWNMIFPQKLLWPMR